MKQKKKAPKKRSLQRYRSMRDFHKTAEPRGKPARATGDAFAMRTIEDVKKAPKRGWHSSRGADENTTLAELIERIPTKVKFGNLDKALFPDEGITKGAVIAYYATIAEHMLPHIKDRPLSLLRCPDGRNKCFFQKHAKNVSDLIGRVTVSEAGGEREQHMYVDSLDGLLAIAQLGVLEIHAWGCHRDNIERPDQLVLDLDPDPSVRFEQVALTALRVRELLKDIGLTSFVKTTGGKGLHVVAPVARRTDWDAFKTFSKAIAQKMEDTWPLEYVVNMAKKERREKIFIDYLRNGRGATAIGVYSTRAREGATVAAPLSWSELENAAKLPQFNLMTMSARIKAHGDAWRDYFDVEQAITAAMKKKLSIS